MTRAIKGLDGLGLDETNSEAERMMAAIGRRVREGRKRRGMTLSQLSGRTGISTSMLSMLERGLSSASVGTLVAVASALGTTMGELFEQPDGPARSPVTRRDEQPAITTPHGALRRIAHHDEAAGVEIAVNEYEPGGSSGDIATHHDGTEFGVVVVGRVRVEIESDIYELAAGDAIEYASARPHRISNPTGSRAVAVWVNVGQGRGGRR